MRTYDIFEINDVLRTLRNCRGVCTLRYKGKDREVQVLEHTEDEGSNGECVVLCYQFADSAGGVKGGFRKFICDKIETVVMNVANARATCYRQISNSVDCLRELDAMAANERAEKDDD